MLGASETRGKRGEKPTASLFAVSGRPAAIGIGFAL